MKTFLKIESQLYNLRNHSEKFATASIKLSSKNKAGEWENAFIGVNFFNPAITLNENTVYTFTGSMGVHFSYKDYPSKPTINADKVEVSASQDGFRAPRAKENAPQQPKTDSKPFPEMETSDKVPF